MTDTDRRPSWATAASVHINRSAVQHGLLGARMMRHSQSDPLRTSAPLHLVPVS